MPGCLNTLLRSSDGSCQRERSILSGFYSARERFGLQATRHPALSDRLFWLPQITHALAAGEKRSSPLCLRWFIHVRMFQFLGRKEWTSTRERSGETTNVAEPRLSYLAFSVPAMGNAGLSCLGLFE